jgi:hypothetical protein
MFDWYDRLKKWFYAIPLIVFLRKIQSMLPPPFNYLFNWLGHLVICLLVTLACAWIGMFIWIMGHYVAHWTAQYTVVIWTAAAIGATTSFVFYLIGELIGFFRPGSKSKWWDHLGDMIGPIAVLIVTWCLRQ